MERFAIKIDNSVKLNLYRLCRLCGIDNPDKQPIIDTRTLLGIQESDDEPSLCKKILDCVGVQVKKNDQMPQSICCLCADKINDFFEYREMCTATNIQTRKLLGLPEMTIASTSGRKRKKTNEVKFNEGESILGILGKEEDDKTDIIDSIPVKKSRKNVKDSQKTAKSKKNNLIVAKEEDEDEIKIEDGAAPSITKKGKAKANLEVAGKKKPTKSVKFAAAADLPLLTLKEPNERERKRELQMQKIEQKKRKGGPNVALIPMAKKLKVETDTTPTIAPVVIPSKSCRICPDIFESVHLLNEHYTSSHVPTVYEHGCSSCIECFKTLAEHKDHLLWHSLSQTMYTCGICNAEFDKTQTFTRHFSHCASNGSAAVVLDDVPCAICNLVFPTKNLHDWHDCYMRPNGQCQRCHRHFVRKNILFKHAVRCTAKPQTKKLAPIVAAQDLPMVSLPPNAVKSEPEAIIDTEGATLTIHENETSDNDYASNHGDDHFAQSDESDPNDDVAASEAIAHGEIDIKSEPTTVNYADEDDDDVILIEDTIDPIIIGDTSPPKKKDRKSKKHKRDRQRTQMLMMAIKQEPRDDTEHPLTNSTEATAESNEPMVRIKMEPIDDTELPTSSSVLTKKKDKKKHKHKRNKRPIPEVPNVIIKQEPIDANDVSTAATPPSSSSPPQTQHQPSHKESNLMPPQQPLVTLPNINEHITMPTVVMNNIKKEPSSVGYDVFDPKVALNIKKERGIDKSKQPSLRLKITKEHGTLNAKIIPNQSKEKGPPTTQRKPNKSKNVYKKPALLAEKIRQEMMQRLAKDKDSSSSDALQIPIIANVHTQLDTQLMLRAIKEERRSPDPEFVYTNDLEVDNATNDTANTTEEIIDTAVSRPEQSTENTDNSIEQPEVVAENTDKASSGERTTTIIHESAESCVELDSLKLPATIESSPDISDIVPVSEPTISSMSSPKQVTETELFNTAAQLDETESVDIANEAVSENNDNITKNSKIVIEYEVSEEKSISVESAESSGVVMEPMTNEVITDASSEQSNDSVVADVKIDPNSVNTVANHTDDFHDVISISKSSFAEPNQEILLERASSLDSIDDLSSEVVKQLETLLEQSDTTSMVPPAPHTSIVDANIFETSAPHLSPDSSTVYPARTSSECENDYTETDVMSHVAPICNPETIESTSIIPADLDIDTHEFAASTADTCDGKLNKSHTSYDDDLEDISDDSLSSDLQNDDNPIDLDLEKRLLDEPSGGTNY